MEILPYREPGADQPVSSPAISSDKQPIMSLGAHLEELRYRLLTCLIFFCLIFIVCLILGPGVFALALAPLRQTAEMLNLDTEQAARIQGIALGPFEGVSALAGFSLRLALVISLPWLLGQVWAFVSPGLKPQEIAAIRPLALFGSGMFCIGMVVGYFYAAPMAFAALFYLNHSWLGLENLWSVQNSLNLVQMICLAFGLVFELPLLMLLLGKLELITVSGLLQYWRQAILAIFLCAAFFTPPDPVTQILLGMMLIGLYFFGILLVYIAGK